MQGTIANNSLTLTPLHTHIMDLERVNFLELELISATLKYCFTCTHIKYQR